MNRVMKAGAFGAAGGFLVMLSILIFHVHSSLIVNALWPTHFLANPAKGSLWMLTFGLLGFFANALLYGLIGYGVGRLMFGREESKRTDAERR